MAGFNGSGTFVRVHNWVTDKGNAVKVTASRMDAEDDGFATGLSTAICKDGQTTTTANIPFAVGVSVSDGSVGTPAIKFINDTDCGFYRLGANNVGLSIGGAKVWDFGTATASVAGAVVIGGTLNAAGGVTFSDGAEATPSITFASDTNTGFYASAADAIGLSLGGSKVVDFNTTGVAVTGTLSSSGNLAVNTDKFTVSAASGNAAVAGDLAVTGAFALNTNKFTISAASGNAAVAGDATVGGTLGVTGAVTLTGNVSAATISGAVVATTANQVTGTAINLVVTSGRQPYHPSAAKGWVYAGIIGNAVVSFNVSSVTDGAGGAPTINWGTDFADANYCPNSDSFSSAAIANSRITAITAGTTTIANTNSVNGAADPDGHFCNAFGTYA